MAVIIKVAEKSHIKYANTICKMIEEAAKFRGTGIAKRKPEYIEKKIIEEKAVVALDGNKIVGFCYIESWENHRFVANSGLIVHPEYRNSGLAKKIKKKIFRLSRKKFPNSKIFGITTSLAVMKINSELNYRPVTFSELTTDETFWKGCQNCSNYDILQRTGRKMCLCTGMVYDPEHNKSRVQKQKGKNGWEAFKKVLQKTSSIHYSFSHLSFYSKLRIRLLHKQ